MALTRHPSQPARQMSQSLMVNTSPRIHSEAPLRQSQTLQERMSVASVVSQVEQLRRDMEVQQSTLAKVADHLLNQGALEDLKSGLAQQQVAQEIQAKALHEGLMQLHEQRTGLAKVEDQLQENQ